MLLGYFGNKIRSIAYLLREMNIYIEYWTYYGICAQRAFKNARVNFINKIGQGGQ